MHNGPSLDNFLDDVEGDADIIEITENDMMNIKKKQLNKNINKEKHNINALGEGLNNNNLNLNMNMSYDNGNASNSMIFNKLKNPKAKLTLQQNKILNEQIFDIIHEN